MYKWVVDGTNAVPLVPRLHRVFTFYARPRSRLTLTVSYWEGEHLVESLFPRVPAHHVVEIPDSLRLVFTGILDEAEERFVFEIP